MGTAFVTGALGGIGSAICRALARDGLDVVGLDLLPAKSEGYEVYELDLGRDDCGERFSDLLGRWEDVTALVNCAAIYRRSNVLTLDVGDFDRTYAVNVRGPFLLAQAFARHLAGRSATGCIVNVSSLAGRNGSVNVDYGVSKGAIDALTKSLAKALCAQRIRVNAVAPGLIDTGMGRQAPDEVRRTVEASLPGRPGTPEEVAEVVAFLCRPAANT